MEGGNFSSNGNRVYVGNFDQDGLNVDNNWDDNRNDNLGLAASRHFDLWMKNRVNVGGRIRGHGLDPPSQHPADFIDRRFKREIFLIVDDFYFFRETHKKTQDIQFYACGFQHRQFRGLRPLTGEQDEFE